MTPSQALPILETLRDCRPSDTLAHQALAMAIDVIRIQLPMKQCPKCGWWRDSLQSGCADPSGCPSIDFDEARADVIASNGNDGEHYAELTPTPFRGRVTRREG